MQIGLGEGQEREGRDCFLEMTSSHQSSLSLFVCKLHYFVTPGRRPGIIAFFGIKLHFDLNLIYK